ncbi:unnamed protein product [Lactuca saligna]|uniref:MYB transcription factor n=1 Tax=Lactuca saligna TaxID=75948 RepID=A0AA35Z7M3_LACSI|nr:unnamed protein product [Lactuca saligna]
MGAPKQKWTSEEEAALKAGVLKHGAGKWRTILKDPEFSSVLYLRSNVDLKDKWRNMSVMANGWGSREKASDEDSGDVRPLQSSSGSPQVGASKRSMIRLDNLIMEAINNLKEHGGSNKTTIGTYIEEQYWAPPNFKRLLSMKLKFLTATGKLVKTKRKYKIASANASSSDKKRVSTMLRLEGRHKGSSPKVDKDEINVPTKAQIDLELQKMRSMTPQEAAAAAAQAVAEAEAAIAEAEEAAREAEAAEADAEAAQAFAEAAMKTLKGRTTQRMMIRA